MKLIGRLSPRLHSAPATHAGIVPNGINSVTGQQRTDSLTVCR